MIIVAAGDSFIWGNELADSTLEKYSRGTFTALLAKEHDYVCVANPGNANNAISRTAINACVDYKDVFLIATWTYPQRCEFRFSDQWKSINSWHVVEPEFSKQYFKHAGNSEYYEIYSTVKEIVFLQQYCQINHIPYMFLTADNHFYLHENYLRSQDAGLNNLYDQIDWSKWFWFPPADQGLRTPRGFCQWAVENKYSVGPQGHPLEQAHYDAAKLIKGKFNELVAEFNQ